jgi:serine/threonine-protein kinase
VVGGRFVLCDPLARAATGTVWRAWDVRHERYCAAKLVRRRDGADALRFAREQGVRLRHPHLLTPYTWVADGGRVLLASPLAEGGSLRRLLDEYGPLAPPTVADLLDQLLDGLADLHAAGVVHRGVTQATLLLDATYARAPRLRLAGFGRAGDGGEPEGDLLAAGEVAAAMLVDGGAPGRLGAVVAALRAADPRDRPTAQGAREALRAQPADPPRTAAGDRVVLLDRLPGLPPGWSTEGPASTAPAPAPAPAARAAETPAARAAETPGAAAPGVERAAPAEPGWPTLTVTSDGAGAPDPDADPDAEGTADRERGGRRRAVPEHAAWGRPAPEHAAPRRATGHPRRTAAYPRRTAGHPRPAMGHPHRRPAAVAAATVLVLAGAGVVIAGTGDRPGPGTRPPGTTSPAPPAGSVAAGAPCDWQREGDAVTGAGGEPLRCVLTGDGYRWTAG